MPNLTDEQIKYNTRKFLLEKYVELGKDAAVQIAEQALVSKSRAAKDPKTMALMNGELCETVLEIILGDYGKKTSKDWCWGRGIILKDPDNPKSKFLTELDHTLFTPECIYIFECKSYSGNNKLVSPGIIKREDGREFNVFQQNRLHLEILHKNLGRFTLPGKSPRYKICLFDFSRGSTTDVRPFSERTAMPLVDKRNLLSVIETGEKVWDMNGLRQARELLIKEKKHLQQNHLEYVVSLHGEGK